VTHPELFLESTITTILSLSKRERKGKRKKEAKATTLVVHDKWSPQTTTNDKEKAQPITDKEIAATKTGQEEINDKQWGCNHQQSMISFHPMADGYGHHL
jgi:hypothetical protein